MSDFVLLAAFGLPFVPLLLTWAAFRLSVTRKHHLSDRHTVDKGVGCLTLSVSLPVLAAVAYAVGVRPRLHDVACRATCASAIDAQRISSFLAIGTLVVVLVIVLAALHAVAEVAEDLQREMAAQPPRHPSQGEDDSRPKP